MGQIGATTLPEGKKAGKSSLDDALKRASKSKMTGKNGAKHFRKKATK
jgi:hypothetical protein